MSGAAVRLAREGPAAAAVGVAAEERDSLALRIVAFAGLASFGIAHWWAMVLDSPGGQAAAVVGVATGGAAILALLSQLRLPRLVTILLASAASVATLAVGLGVAGLQPRLMLPGGWSELLDGLDRGLSGVGTIDWPYDGPDDWVRLTIMLGAPLLLAFSAVLAFWPGQGRRRFGRAAALVLLLLLYGIAVTNHDPGSQLTRGFVLLLLVAAWQWLPHLGRRDAVAAAAAVVAVGVCSLPVASALDGSRPWWNYRSFNWFGGGKTVTYDWNHSYGPLSWPRDGTTLLNVKSSQALYWKAEVLDRFDGVRWLRVAEGHTGALAGLPEHLRQRGRHWNYFEYNPRWDHQGRVTVRALHSDLVVGPGTIYEVKGAGSTVTADDGTTTKVDGPLERGHSYTVTAYAPKPTAVQMRGAPAAFPQEMTRYTELALPGTGELSVPLRGDPLSGTPGTRRVLSHSAYAAVYRLAHRLTAGAPTAYDAVARVESYLQRRYRYEEDPPRRRLPLAAFLLRDRVGYCQQFSGAMALMLRMVGIPSRVAAGFSPGSFNRHTGEYRVRDLDAHSWVEVFFNGIGWVTFDPTPAAAPAATRSSGITPGSSDTGRAAEVSDRPVGSPGPESGAAAAGPGGGRSGGLGWWILPLALAATALAWAAWLGLRRVARWRPVTEGDVAEAQLRELAAALPRLGLRLPSGSTLLAIERRLARLAGPDASGYVARLRAHRYERGAPAAPDRAARRALRRALAAAAGRRGRLRALAAIPPGGPFRRL